MAASHEVKLLNPNEAGAHSAKPSDDIYPLKGESFNNDTNDASPWAAKSVLSFDGGGIRGYSSLLILEALMNEIAVLEEDTEWIDEGLKEKYNLNDRDTQAVADNWGSRDYPWKGDLVTADSNFYPAHYFDYIAGTSTGGLSTIMLGRLGMTVERAKGQYQYFGNEVFGKLRTAHAKSILWFPRSKYSTTRKREALHEVIGTAVKSQDHQIKTEYSARSSQFAMPGHHGQRCQSLVVSFAVRKRVKVKVRQGPHVHRTYDQGNKDYNLGIPTLNTICDVAMATSAAPFLFKAHVIGDHTHYDGGLGFNNPAQIAVNEVCSRHGRAPKLLLSIGTGDRTDKTQTLSKKEQLKELKQNGTSSHRQQFKKYLELVEIAPDMLTDKDQVTINLRSREDIDFRRLDVPTDAGEYSHCLGEVPLDEWLPRNSGEDTLNKIRAMTSEYVRRGDIQEELEDTARQLVLVRRQRARTDRWERYAMDVVYQCCVTDDCRRSREVKNRPTMRRHLEESHRLFPRPDVEKTLNECRGSAQAFAEGSGARRNGRTVSHVSNKGINGTVS